MSAFVLAYATLAVLLARADGVTRRNWQRAWFEFYRARDGLLVREVRR